MRVPAALALAVVLLAAAGLLHLADAQTQAREVSRASGTRFAAAPRTGELLVSAWSIARYARGRYDTLVLALLDCAVVLFTVC